MSTPTKSQAHPQPLLRSRATDLRLALLLTYITLAWMTVEGIASLVLGRLSRSLLLEGFGIDSIVELFSAGVLLWRLRVEASGTASEVIVESVERRASRLVGYSLFALVVYVIVMSAYGLFVSTHHTDTHESVWGILIGLVAKVGMPILAGYKLKVAARLNSRALRADAMEAITCGYLSVVLIIGLAAIRLFGWWWLDSVAALALIPFLVKEGREAVKGMGATATASNGRRWRETTRSLWTNRDFLLIWLGQAVSYFGTRVSNLALPLIALALTHSAAQAGFVASARMLPYLIFGLPAGALVDRWNRRTVMIVCDLVRFLALGSVPLAFAFGRLDIPQLYLVTFIQGIAFVFFNVAEIAALPHVVPEARLAQATALDATAGSAAALLGPGLAGLVIGAARTTAAGAALAYLVDSLTYLASLISLGFIRTPFQAERTAVPPAELRREMAEGLRFLWSEPHARALALLTTALGLLYAPVPLAMIVLARGPMHATPGVIGLIFSLAAVGGLLGSALAPWFKSRYRLGQVMFGCVAVQALLTPILALAVSPWMLALGWGLLFLIDPIFFASSITYRLSVTPDELQGRAQSVFRLLSYGAEPLGTAAGGLLLGLYGPRPLIWGVAAGVALCALVVRASGLRRA